MDFLEGAHSWLGMCCCGYLCILVCVYLCVRNVCVRGCVFVYLYVSVQVNREDLSGRLNTGSLSTVFLATGKGHHGFPRHNSSCPLRLMFSRSLSLLLSLSLSLSHYLSRSLSPSLCTEMGVGLFCRRSQAKQKEGWK